MEELLLCLLCILIILLILCILFIYHFVLINTKYYNKENNNDNKSNKKDNTHDYDNTGYHHGNNRTICNKVDIQSSIVPRRIELHNSNMNINPHSKPDYNIAMQGSYQQVGTLSSFDTLNNPIILPLFGRRLNRNKWEYYTSTEHNNQIRIGLNYNNKACDEEYGCDEISSGEEVEVPTYSKSFIVKLYRYNSFVYNSDIF